MHSYHKMLNLFKFHPETKGRTTEMSCPEFEYGSNPDRRISGFWRNLFKPDSVIRPCTGP